LAGHSNTLKYKYSNTATCFFSFKNTYTYTHKSKHVALIKSVSDKIQAQRTLAAKIQWEDYKRKF